METEESVSAAAQILEAALEIAATDHSRLDEEIGERLDHLALTLCFILEVINLRLVKIGELLERHFSSRLGV